ncbi:MAG: hypothetical protein Q9173_004963 [Seirophora scorigena]
MPRTLPWLKDQTASKAKTSTAAPPPKRARAPSLDLSSSDHERSAARARARAHQRREAAQRTGRTPSTSPPPAPPPVEYMRPDDEIYMMVEDEFLSTAHLFTSHLHHAEYVRLKTLARSSSSTGRNPLLAPQQRPTDSITAMRAETLRKKQADAKAVRSKAAVEQMKRDARGGIDASSSDLPSPSESEDDEEEAKHPWAGTSLQGLMARDARTQNLTSLRGIQGIKSSTRAAKGYGMRKTHPPRSKPPLNPSPSFSSNTSSDLDAPLTRPKPTNQQPPAPRPPPPHPPSSSKPSNPHKNNNNNNNNNNNPLTLAAEDLFHSTTTKPPPVGVKNKEPKPHHERLAPTTSPPPPRSKLFDNEQQQPTTARRRVQARREREEKRRREEDANVNVNEMPVFLV